MKKILYFLLLGLIVFGNACTKDPLKDLENTDWQKDRNIVSILLEGQIGTAVIDRDGDNANITVYAVEGNIADISKVEVIDIQLSYGASTPNANGTTLDLTNGNAQIEVVSGSGSTLTWNLTMVPFVSDLSGTWYLKNIGLYCDFFTWESWGWEEYLNLQEYLPNAYAEMDNEFTFVVEGADDAGNPFGSFTHSAGTDGEFANFVDDDNGWDFNERYRTVPTGEGTWLRDFERGVVVLTDADGNEKEFTLEIDQTSGEVTLKVEIPYLPDLFDWDNTNWTYEKLAHMSNPMWYTLTNDVVTQTGNDITTFAIVDQVGDAEFDNDNKTITVTVPDNGVNPTSVEIAALEISYGATADAEVGTVLNLDGDLSATINVTAQSGDAATWTITAKVEVDPNSVSIEGSWSIGEMAVYCDLFTWEDWGWDKTELINNYLPQAGAELDNTITFTVDGFNGDMPYGSFENNAGGDAAFANFVSDDASWPETEFNERFRKVPTGMGTWVKEADTIIITDENSMEFRLTLEVNADNEIVLKTDLEFLPDLFDWDVQNYSYEEVAHMSKYMWYKLNRQ